MAEGMLYHLAEGLIIEVASLAAQEVALWCGLDHELRRLGGTITTIKGVLIDADERARKHNNQVRIWLGKLREAMLDAEDLLDDFSTEDLRKQLMPGSGLCKEVCIFFSASNQFVYGLIMAHRVKALRKRLDAIDDDSRQFNFVVREEENASLTMVRELATPFEPEIVIGRKTDIEAIKSFLFDPKYDENVSVISIVGIGGLGKTTLAQRVFNDKQVMENFGELRLWVSVSGGFDVTKILKEAVGSRRDSDRLESLKIELEEKINNRKYLLVIDDISDGQDDGEKWDRLKQLLPRTARGSKIVMTTRSHIIAKFTSTIPPHALQGLGDEDSWDLFGKKAFPQRQESSHRVNEEIRREIVERCCGVPLVIKSIARLMSLKDRAQWLSFIKQELPLRVQDDNIIQTLKLSFDPLPPYMKHCFAYCSLFPKGHWIDVKLLVQLWIAQGFISSSNPNESLEIAGLRCYENLLWRSFFHEVTMDGSGNITRCKMHDFMHDLAAKVAGFESAIVDQEGLGISDSTRHVSFGIELDLSQQIPIPLASAKRLRTLILPLRNWDKEECIWELICQDFRCIRVLDLHGLVIKKVSPFIEKFKLLKYLDLSHNAMEALPNSITNLINLQVLKLNGCLDLKALPGDIHKLINLRHLENDACSFLEYMPCGIGKLTCLQTLSCFVVAKTSPESKMVGGLDELGRLNELRGSLEIRVKGYERNSCISEFEGAKLIEKQYLQSLTVRWDSDSDIDLYDEMLQSLRPHSNLQYLSVGNYEGTRLSSWVSRLPNLVRIDVESCSAVKHIPPLDGIPSLEELIIVNLPNLVYIDSEGVTGRGVSTFFPSLKKISIEDCTRLKGWWKKSDEINDDSDESTTTTEEELMRLYFPCLSSLTIVNCPKLSSMPLFPTLDDQLYLLDTSSVPLQQTMKMRGWKSTPSVSSSSSSFVHPLSKLKKLHILYIEDMESLSEDVLQNLSSLQQLSIWACPRLKALHLPDQGTHSLLELSIWNCKELRSLSESLSQGIPNLPFLQELDISKCSEELSGRLREEKEAVEYWPNIKHIPTIKVDGYYIQKDGCYVEENLRHHFRI